MPCGDVGRWWHARAAALFRRGAWIRYSASIAGPGRAFFGRAEELDTLRTAMGRARNRQASGVALIGDPGIGKTALLAQFSARDAADARVLEIAGHTSETDLPYAGLDRLLIQLHDAIGDLAPRFREALGVATGRLEGEPPDRFQVGLALLTLLGSLGSPTAVIVDDAHLLDTETLSTLAFVARRVNAEPVLLVFTLRPHADAEAALSGIEMVHLGGLDTLSGVALVNHARASPLDPALAVSVVEQLTGHPLALADLSRHADLERFALRTLSVEPLPPGAMLEDLYRREIAKLPAESREFMLVAATDTTGDVEVVRAAARDHGLPDDASRALEGTGLLTLDARVQFRHQLVRAAIYNAAALIDRQRAHLALESASQTRGYHAAAALHAAAVATAPDDPIADRLAALADDAGTRGALISRAGLLIRAAELTTAGPQQVHRRLAAAEAALGAGAAVLASGQLDRIDVTALSGSDLGRLRSARALLALFVADPERLPLVVSQFVQAADAFAAASPHLQQRALMDAFWYGLATEAATEGIALTELAARVRDGASADDGLLADLLRGTHALLALPLSEAAPVIRRALVAACAAEGATLSEGGLCTIPLALAVWDLDAAREVIQRLIDDATRLGSLRLLDTIHWTVSTFYIQTVDVAAAGVSLESVRELRRAVGYSAEHVVNAAHLAMTGAPMAMVDAIAAAIRPTGFAGAWTVVQAGISGRLIADGEYDAAFERLTAVIAAPFPHVSRLALPDYIEAAVRSGHPTEADAALTELQSCRAVVDSRWLDGLAERSLALIGGGDAETHHLAAIEHLTAARASGDLARAHLVYGEWLRRQRRRREARVQLTTAVNLFDACDAGPFAQRARAEFAATGESLPPPASDASLTPREALVSTLAGEGKSNQEIAAALFVSPNTVDYHLRKVFRKLGITSRRQLRDRTHD